MNAYITNNYTSAYSGHRPVANITWIEHPSSLVLLCDAEVADYDGTGREHSVFHSITLITSPNSRNTSAWRHSKGQNILFVDGHVEYFERARKPLVQVTREIPTLFQTVSSI